MTEDRLSAIQTCLEEFGYAPEVSDDLAWLCTELERARARIATLERLVWNGRGSLAWCNVCGGGYPHHKESCWVA